MASNARNLALGCIKIPILENKDQAVAALVIGLLQLCGPSFDVHTKKESFQQVIELMDMEGTLSLRLLVIAQYTPSEPFKAQESDPENIWDDSQDVTYVTKGPFSPAELLEAMQQARKERKRLRKSRQVPPRNFRVIVPIDNSNDLAIAPENTAVIESSVAAALDTALSKLSAQRTIRKRPKPLMWNRQTVVRKKTVVGNAGSWEVDSESSGWDDPDSEVEGLDVQHNQSTWSEDSFFTQNKKLGKYRCYYKSLLRWNWKIKEVEGGNERDLAEICEEDWQFLEEYDNTSIEKLCHQLTNATVEPN